ncbi:class II aldolase/adducin family protein [Oceanicoccus sagamiensis]|uniref:Class II aldolase n=1 Tax=Oceanicoccus sagamiensis TaxID=716816 RepID=A0A1X9NL21_9GAMM|nr:class II aldolase/adducin family protein [Oceanicoccus sagamiensis]ARN74643.1 class II aldolase [Oceanicoccus sagamiensis]
MKDSELRQQLIDYAIQLNRSGLSAGKSGNISARCHEGLLITPTGMDYHELSPEDIVLLTLEGGQASTAQNKLPSSEWHFHCGIYQARPDIHAVVHAHPTHSTALACTGRAIPAFHYMVAVAGGKQIPIAPYALFGTEELSRHVVDTLQGYQACLLANHGMIALGGNLRAAFNLAVEVESLAQQYCQALALGKIQLLTDQQMDKVMEKFKAYGQRV